MGISFDNSFQRLPPLLFERVEPTPLKNPKLMALSPACLRDMGWSEDGIDANELVEWLNGTRHWPGEQRISTRYAGHQFGVWAGQLGDGRAISLGEFLHQGRRFEIQTKGSGLTPFSRMGDGKAVIRSSVREFLCSEAMAALGIPTTRALALINGEDEVERESVERSALVARVFPSNLRFGHFEYCFHFDHPAELKELEAYTRTLFFPEAATTEEMLEEIVRRTADLIAAWQSVGFAHGVMNTDNMSILGLTIDYGPFGFLENTRLDHICNHSDHRGRYSFGKQPNIALWNLERLLVCFTPFVDRDRLLGLLGQFAPRFTDSWLRRMSDKLGLSHQGEKDADLITDLIGLMHENEWDFTFFFRSLCSYEAGKPESLEAFWRRQPKDEAFDPWLRRYDERLIRDGMDPGERRKRQRKVNPKYVLRNHIAQDVIEAVEKDDDRQLRRWLNVLLSPDEEHPEFDSFAGPTPPARRNLMVSCSS
ncbi:MAG: YdiU family protein [Bdellovibrionaceae bacterium]|nr:YdiU family protein [Pseudobdellovibrionaceae bacterium]